MVIETQSLYNSLGYIAKVESCERLFITNSTIHKYNTRTKDKMRSVYVKHKHNYARLIIKGCPQKGILGLEQ